MTEQREGGTLPGRTAPDGQPFVQTLDSKRFDGGLVAEIPLAPGTLNIRGSGMTQSDDHHFGTTIEGDRRRTFFGEARSEEHTSELQSLMRNSVGVFCLKTNNN